MNKESYKITEAKGKLFISDKDEFFAGNSLEFRPNIDDVLDPFDTPEDAKAALELFIEENKDLGSVSKPEPEPVYKEYTVHFSISGHAKVIASDKKEALLKLSELTFGDRVNRDNSTVTAVNDLPAEELS